MNLPQFGKMLMKVRALQLGPIELPEGKLSPYHLDLRAVPMFSSFFKHVVGTYVSLARRKIGAGSFESVCGIAWLGAAVASPLALRMGKSLVLLEAGAVGSLVRPGDRILVVDGVVATGRTILAAKRALEGEGGVVEHALVLVNKEEGGEELLLKNGVRLVSYVKISSLVKRMYRSGLISKEERDAVLKHVEAQRSIRSSLSSSL